MTLARVLLVPALLLHSTMALRVASDAKVTRPWPEALEEARGILAKDCGAECLRILDTVVAPALNGTEREQVLLCLVDEPALVLSCNARSFFAR